ncbi:MAG: hypothetical protein MI976_30820 [Pseudomonadales bacterium]|nr:hypothetical protein [Pseudomonadales bacterium]
MITNRIISIAFSAFLLVFSLPGYAYLGPGAGLSAIGSAIALLAAILVAIVGFLWFPIKRMRAKKNQQDIVEDDLDDTSDPQKKESN